MPVVPNGVGNFATRLNVPMAIIDKRRVSDTQVKQGLVVGDVVGKDVIIYDDEISTGGTLLTTVDTLKKAGAGNIYVGATHPVLCGKAVENLKKSSIKEVVVTNTVEIPEKKQIDIISCISMAPILAEAIRRIHTGESIGELFLD